MKWVAVRDMTRKRDVELSSIRVTDQPFDLVNDPEVEILIEVAGGVTPAYELIKSAITQGKHIVTANKEVIAKHGSEIFELAHRHNVTVLFEAAVGGGIPLISTIQRGLAGQRNFKRRRHSQRHNELYSDRDARARAEL